MGLRAGAACSQELSITGHLLLSECCLCAAQLSPMEECPPACVCTAPADLPEGHEATSDPEPNLLSGSTLRVKGPLGGNAVPSHSASFINPHTLFPGGLTDTAVPGSSEQAPSRQRVGDSHGAVRSVGAAGL